MRAGPSSHSAQRQQRRHGEQAAPDHEAERVDPAGAPRDQVGPGPAQRRRQDHGQAEGRDRAAVAVRSRSGDAGRGQRQRGDLHGCSRSRPSSMARPMVKNTWVWITSEARPGVMSARIARNSSPNWPCRAARRRPPACASGPAAGARTAGREEASAKRSAANRKGGSSARPHLMTTKLVPQTEHHEQREQQVRGGHRGQCRQAGRTGRPGRRAGRPGAPQLAVACRTACSQRAISSPARSRGIVGMEARARPATAPPVRPALRRRRTPGPAR